MWKNSIFWIYYNCILLNQYYCRCLILELSWRVAVMALLLVTCIGLNNWSLEAQSKIRLDISPGKFKSADSAKICSFFKSAVSQILLLFTYLFCLINFTKIRSLLNSWLYEISFRIQMLHLPNFAPFFNNWFYQIFLILPN